MEKRCLWFACNKPLQHAKTDGLQYCNDSCRSLAGQHRSGKKYKSRLWYALETAYIRADLLNSTGVGKLHEKTEILTRALNIALTIIDYELSSYHTNAPPLDYAMCLWCGKTLKQENKAKRRRYCLATGCRVKFHRWIKDPDKPKCNSKLYDALEIAANREHTFCNSPKDENLKIDRNYSLSKTRQSISDFLSHK